jgi:hypothetical protein
MKPPVSTTGTIIWPSSAFASIEEREAFNEEEAFLMPTWKRAKPIAEKNPFKLENLLLKSKLMNPTSSVKCALLAFQL